MVSTKLCEEVVWTFFLTEKYNKHSLHQFSQSSWTHQVKQLKKEVQILQSVRTLCGETEQPSLPLPHKACMQFLSLFLVTWHIMIGWSRGLDIVFDFISDGSVRAFIRVFNFFKAVALKQRVRIQIRFHCRNSRGEIFETISYLYTFRQKN